MRRFSRPPEMHIGLCRAAHSAIPLILTLLLSAGSGGAQPPAAPASPNSTGPTAAGSHGSTSVVAPAPPAAAAPTSWDDARIINVSSNNTAVRVVLVKSGSADEIRSLSVPGVEAQKSLGQCAAGDRVAITFVDKSPDHPDIAAVLQTIHALRFEVSPMQRWCTLGVVMVALLLLYGLLLRKRLNRLIIGADNRYSNSKFQIVVWFTTLIATYIAALVLRCWYGHTDFMGGVNIPQNLLLLSGLSAVTFAAAKSITVNAVAAATAAGQVNVKSSAPAPSFPNDLFTDDQGNVDMADFQTVIITMLAVIVYLARIYGFLGVIELHSTVTLPDVDTTILAMFGLGHGAYLAKKYVGDAVVPPAQPQPAQPQPAQPQPVPPQPAIVPAAPPAVQPPP